MPYKDYPDLSNCRKLMDSIGMYAQQKHEFGAAGLGSAVARLENALNHALCDLKAMPVDERKKRCEPDDLPSIRSLRAPGPRTLWKSFDRDAYRERLEGALLCRLAGCTLGAAVEGWSVGRMEKWAAETGDAFPPVDYWSQSPTALTDRYTVSKFRDYLRDTMDGVPADDDIIYTMVGLMLLEKHGVTFTTEDSVKTWLEYLDWVWVDMEIPENNYKSGTPVAEIAEDNPFNQMICAGIRCDPFGYVMPGQPEKAAALAYKDSYASHRRNGLYGGMFFAASISAAFAVDHPIDAVEIGLGEIPAGSELAKAVLWALKTAPGIRDCHTARQAVDERYGGMVVPHTINNACLTVFGLALGQSDVTKVISNTVAMGLDNDCSTATAGSIVGAVVGKRNVPEHWTRPFHNTIHTYIKENRTFRIDDVVNRYAIQAEKAFSNSIE